MLRRLAPCVTGSSERNSPDGNAAGAEDNFVLISREKLYLSSLQNESSMTKSPALDVKGTSNHADFVG